MVRFLVCLRVFRPSPLMRAVIRLKSMRTKFGLLSLIILVAISAISMATWKSLAGRDSIRRTNDYRWYDDSICITDRTYDGAFDYHDVVWGLGACLYLEEGAFDTRTFDGAGYYRIGFQFPREVHVGQTYAFSPVPSDRSATTVSDAHTFSALQTGEFTVMQYGNPLSDCMTDRDPPSTAEVTIEKMRVNQIVVHVKLHAVLPEMGNLDLNQKYTAKRFPSDGG